MKFILSFLLLFAISVHGQTKLNGTFVSTTDSIISSWITFNNDSSFEFTSVACLSHQIGEGIYKLQEKNLTFYFVGNKMPKDPPGKKFPKSHYPIKDGTVYSYEILKQSADTLILRENNYTIVYLKIKK